MTQVIKIYHPSKSVDQIGAESTRIREEVLKLFPGNQMSYSFASHKESGYIMVYPTPPILSIRISTHTTDGEVPVDKLIEEDGKSVTVNAEVENGEGVAEAIIIAQLSKLKSKGQDIKHLLMQHGLI
mgnify:CR=1 FL=1